MYQRKRQHSAIRRQWRYLSSRLNAWVKDGRFAQFSQSKQERLRKQLHRLLRQMVRLESAGHLRKALGGAALLLALGATPAQAQVNFAPAQENPFGLTVRDELTFDILADMDGDGDLDIVSVTYEDSYYSNLQVLSYQENVSTDGGATAVFSAAQDFFGLALPEIEDGNFLRPELVDIDNDGDLDLMLGFYDYYEGKIFFFANEGTAQAPVFGEAQINPFGIDLAGSNASTPNFADMDGDGDLDMLSLFYSDNVAYSPAETGILYQENIGTATAPMFDTPVREPFGLPTELSTPIFFTLGDIDKDGDIDMLAGTTEYDYDTYLIDYLFYENTGDAANPAFADVALNPFGITPQTGIVVWPILGDLDKDGDLDLLNGSVYNEETYENGWVYQENLLLDVGLNDLADELTQIAVFPTVSDGNYNLQISTDSSPLAVTLRVYNTQGQLLQQQAYPATTRLDAQLQLHAYPAGTYHLQVRNGDRQWTGTVIKQ